MLVTADETGLTAGIDLRMVGGKDGKKALLWQSRNPTGGITCLAVASRPSDGETEPFNEFHDSMKAICFGEYHESRHNAV